MRTPAVLVGQAVGDALGMPFEKLGDEVHPDLAAWAGEYRRGTWHDLPAGHWTDDTEMAECLATSLIECRGYDGTDVARRYLAWSQATPHGMGGTTRQAMELLARGVSWRDSGIEFKNPYEVGSGPPMRAAPIGVHGHAPEQIFHMCHQDAYITHASPEATAASYAVATAVRLSLDGWSEHRLLDEVTRLVILTEHEHGFGATQVREDLQRACVQLNHNMPAHIIAPHPFSRRGNARSITATAIYCAARHHDFKSGVIAAIKLGGDTDTRAAITGAILGARFGLEGISAEYKEGLLRFHDLARLDHALLEAP